MPTGLPRFEPDIARAHTLPGRMYLDPEIYALETERIFARTWQPVGRTSQVKNPGDFFTCEVAGEQVVVLCDKDGALRAFYNVCRHRAGPVAIGCGSRKSLTCRYHGWTYALDGSLLTTPEFEGVACFDKKENGLTPVHVDSFGPLIFVNLDKDPPPLHAVLGDIPEQTAGLPLKDMTFCERREYVVSCNWKIYIDNYLEGYHIPLVHPALYRELDYSAYRVDTYRYHSFQHAPFRASAPGQKEDRPYADADADSQALYYWIFPGWMLNVYPNNLQWNGVFPLGADRTLTVFEWYALDAESLPAIKNGIEFGEKVQREDIEICEAVHKRIGSRAYDRGRYSVKRENGVHHFHGLVLEFLEKE